MVEYYTAQPHTCAPLNGNGASVLCVQVTSLSHTSLTQGAFFSLWFAEGGGVRAHLYVCMSTIVGVVVETFKTTAGLP